jgi:hypothetical protein
MRHLQHLTDDRGILEHARGTQPLLSHGYCTDDNARLLVVCARDRDSTPGATELGRIAARFVIDAQDDTGRFHNRLNINRVWTDQPSVDDCWGRALWGLGTAISTSRDDELGAGCRGAFDAGIRCRSSHLRATCFAVLGAAEVVSVAPLHHDARRFLLDARDVLTRLPRGGAAWKWPEPRLAYANALIPEAMIACGEALSDQRLLARGLDLLEWLVSVETLGDHLSPTPNAGRRAGDPQPAFDQQPIEVASIAEAAARAARVTRERRWDDVIDLAVSWFMGNNDTGDMMIDVESGGGSDGLTPTGPSLNQGAESTLAMISTLQFRSSMWLV